MSSLLPADHLPFWRAICLQPHDDLHRLVFADYLEESGEPEAVARAHYIRAQIEQSLLPATDPRYQELQTLITRIEEYFLEDFRRELPQWVIEEGDVEYRRGFPDRLTITFDRRFDTAVREILETYPITALHLSDIRGYQRLDTTPYYHVFEQRPWLEKLTYLGFGPNFSMISSPVEDTAEVGTCFFHSLMTTRSFSQLRTLNLKGNRITNQWLVRFLSRLEQASFAESLRVLDLTDCLLITDAGANILATARGLDQLECLRLRNLELSQSSISMLRRRFGDRLDYAGPDLV
jgi:uncharacterized protein (TIGR02996 family)